MTTADGQFGWAELTTRDDGAASAFYGALFGWESLTRPGSDRVEHTCFTMDCRLVARMRPPSPGAPAGAPSSWRSYVRVTDLDAAVARVQGAGGTISVPPTAEPDGERTAVVEDPAGAVVGMSETTDDRNWEVRGVAGAVGWHELRSEKLSAALPFYTHVFGWSWQLDQPTEYWLATNQAVEGDVKNVAGAMTTRDAGADQVPTGWLVVFAVEDCEDTCRRATALGGLVVSPPRLLGPVRYAGIVDPTGARFEVFQPDVPDP